MFFTYPKQLQVEDRGKKKSFEDAPPRLKIEEGTEDPVTNIQVSIAIFPFV